GNSMVLPVTEQSAVQTTKWREPFLRRVFALSPLRRERVFAPPCSPSCGLLWNAGQMLARSLSRTSIPLFADDFLRRFCARPGLFRVQKRPVHPKRSARGLEWNELRFRLAIACDDYLVAAGGMFEKAGQLVLGRAHVDERGHRLLQH